MKDIYGRFNEIKIYTDIIDDDALLQLQKIADNPIFEGSKIRVMPDVHVGKGSTIGLTMTIKDKVIPNMVGVDIGCGMELTKIKEKDIDLHTLDEVIHSSIPAGRKIRESSHSYVNKISLSDLRCLQEINTNKAFRSIGTLGGGNHFIELDKDEDGNLYLVVHSGSRHLGVEVSSYYQKMAYKALKNKDKYLSIDPEDAYVEDALFDDYIHDMKIVQEFALINRKAIIHEILKGMNLTSVDSFTTIHNYIDIENMILRKGAISARKNEKVLIPINMKEGSLICIGKGNDDWNQSAPHGAGRILSRSDALEILSLDEFKEEMKGIYSQTISLDTLDESPMVYKSKEDIVKYISPSVDIMKTLLPIYNFKAKE